MPIFNLLDTIINTIEPKVKKKGLELKINYNAHLGFMFYGDDLRLSQILINLLWNSVKFTDNGVIELNINKVKEDRYRFQVKDSGIGMTQEQQKKLFENFSQADNSTTKMYGGTGLGLSISKQLVEMMNGSIEVQSKLNVGSSFIFEIELKKLEDYKSCLLSEANDSTDTQKLISKLRQELKSRKGSRILLVEDMDINIDIIVELLGDSGIDIDVEINGEDGLDAFMCEDYELIITDIQMPILDGIDLAKAIRKTNKDIPIVALTANAMQEDIEKSKEAGMNAHLTKPIDIASLYKTILKYTTKKVEVEEVIDDVDSSTKVVHKFNSIDYFEGIKQFSNQIEPYNKILKKFYKTYNSFNIFKMDDESKKVSIHNLKALSNIICATRLNELVIALHNNLDESLYQEFQDELDNVISDIRNNIINN